MALVDLNIRLWEDMLASLSGLLLTDEDNIGVCLGILKFLPELLEALNSHAADVHNTCFAPPHSIEEGFRKLQISCLQRFVWLKGQDFATAARHCFLSHGSHGSHAATSPPDTPSLAVTQIVDNIRKTQKDLVAIVFSNRSLRKF